MKKVVFTFFSGAIVFVGIVGSLVVGYRAYQESERNKEISKEIRFLQDEAHRIDQENRTLSDRIEYLQSDTFREKEAKRILEYQKSDEKVVLIRERVGSSRNASSTSSFSEVPLMIEVSHDAEPNPLKWWREFFDKT
jgi:hypothetical protein